MKTQQYEIDPLKNEQKDALQKLPYEKPRLGTVALFADQVLGGCKTAGPNITCSTIAS